MPCEIPTVSVVVPCAGASSRFAVAYPKELHSMGPDVAVIDRALAPLDALVRVGHRVRLVVVLGLHKLSTAAYLHRYANRHEVVFVYQTERHGEGLGAAIRAALPLCVGDTMLLLPDQILRGPQADEALASALAAARVNGWAVVATREPDPMVLAGEGALRVGRDGRWVLAAREKPGEDADAYDAAWAAVVVRAAVRARLPDVADPCAVSPLVGAAVILVAGFDNVTSADDAEVRRAG